MPTTILRVLIPVVLLGGCVDGDELARVVEPTCGGFYPHIPSMRLPAMKQAAKAAPDAPVLVVTDTAVLLDQRLISEKLDIAALREQLRDSHEHLVMIGKYGGKVATNRIIFAAEPGVAAADAASVLAEIHAAGFKELLVLGAPSSAPEPRPLPDPELAAELRAAPDPSMRMMHLAEAVEGAIWLCPDLTAIFQAIAAADPTAKCELLVAGFREMSAFCMGNQSTLETAMLLMSEPEQYTTFQSFTLAPEQRFDGATWGAALTAASGRIGFAR